MSFDVARRGIPQGRYKEISSDGMLFWWRLYVSRRRFVLGAVAATTAHARRRSTLNGVVGVPRKQLESNTIGTDSIFINNNSNTTSAQNTVRHSRVLMEDRLRIRAQYPGGLCTVYANDALNTKLGQVRHKSSRQESQNSAVCL
jgi:hypothetical protein